MPTPDFVLRLREKIGTDDLWLAGATAVIVRGEEVLLVRRADNGNWTPVTGIIDPGEEPADAAAREALEEASVVIAIDRLARIGVTPPVVYPNGDRAQYLDFTFRCSWVSGEPYPADGEASEARWFPLDALPPMRDDYRGRLEAALRDDERTEFRRSDDVAAAPPGW
jgi:8-oxo-dGTP pyrophosphatase MutT (NUDIX family)